MKNKTSRAAFLKRGPYGLLVDLYNISNQNCISEGAKHDIRSTAGMGREVLKENKVLRGATVEKRLGIRNDLQYLS